MFDDYAIVRIVIVSRPLVVIVVIANNLMGLSAP
jgi:hypothetical protein